MHQLRHRVFSCLALLLISAGIVAPTATPCAAQDAAASTSGSVFGVVAIAGYDQVMKDVGYLGGLGGMPEAGQMVEGMLAMFTQGKGLVGLDKSRPWGFLFSSDAPDKPLVCLPVTDLEALLALGAGAGIEVEDLGDGVHGINTPDGKTVYVKGQDGWAYASENSEQLTALPRDPTNLLKPLVETYDIGVKVLAGQIPAMYKEMAVTQLQEGFEAGLQREEDESDEEFEKRKQIAQMQIDNLRQFIEGTKDATIGLAINPKGGGALMDMVITALPESRLAKQIMIEKPGETRFSGFMDKTASISFASAYGIPKEALDQMVAEFDSEVMVLRQMANEAIDKEESLDNDDVRQTLKSAMDDAISGLKAMVASGKYDMVGHTHLKQRGFSALLAISTPEPKKFDAALKKIVALAEEDPNFPGINWNAETHSGVEIHTFSAPVDKPDAVEVFGNSVRVAVGLGPDAYYLSVGPDSVAALKKAITASAGRAPAGMKPVEMSIALQQLMEFGGAMAESKGEDAGPALMMAQLLSTEAKNKLHITAEGIPNGLRYQFAIEEGVLKAVAAAIAEARRAGFVPQ